MVLAASKSPGIWAQPGTLGFLVVFGMAIILFFVFRSLVKHLRKVNEAAKAESGGLPGGSPPVNGHRPATGSHISPGRRQR
jgi:hypothetical protein